MPVNRKWLTSWKFWLCFQTINNTLRKVEANVILHVTGHVANNYWWSRFLYVRNTGSGACVAGASSWTWSLSSASFVFYRPIIQVHSSTGKQISWPNHHEHLATCPRTYVSACCLPRQAAFLHYHSSHLICSHQLAVRPNTKQHSPYVYESNQAHVSVAFLFFDLRRCNNYSAK